MFDNHSPRLVQLLSHRQHGYLKSPSPTLLPAERPWRQPLPRSVAVAHASPFHGPFPPRKTSRLCEAPPVARRPLCRFWIRGGLTRSLAIRHSTSRSTIVVTQRRVSPNVARCRPVSQGVAPCHRGSTGGRRGSWSASDLMSDPNPAGRATVGRTGVFVRSARLCGPVSGLGGAAVASGMNPKWHGDRDGTGKGSKQRQLPCTPVRTNLH